MKKLYLAILCALLLSAISVFATIQVGTIAVSPAAADPGASVTVSVPITNNDNTVYPVVTFTSTNPFGGTDLGTVATLSNVPNGTTQTATFTVSVPSSRAPGSVSATVTASVSSANQATGTYSFVVNPKPSFSVVEGSLTVAGQPGKAVTKTFTIQNTGNVALSNMQVGHERTDIKDDDGHAVVLSFNPATIASLAVGATQEVTMTATIDAGYAPRTESDRVKIDVAGLSSVFVPLSIDVKPVVCSAGNVGKVDVSIVSPSSNDAFEAGTLIPVRVDVENRDSVDRDVVLEAVLYNLNKRKVVDHFDSRRNVNSDDTQTFKFSLELPSTTRTNDNVRLFVKAYFDNREATDCNGDDIGLDVSELQNKVTIDSLTLSPDVPVCGQTVSGTLHVVNRDSNPQDVTVTIRNDQLAISKQLPSVSLEDAFTRGSDQYLQFSFDMPQTARAGSYILDAIASYDGGTTTWQRAFNVGQCAATVVPPVTSSGTTTTQVATTTAPTTVLTGKTVWDRLGEVPVWFWLSANLFIALLIFILALVALRRKR